MQLKKIKILIIHPLGRAGSLFLQSLLDMHSQILILPDRFKFYTLIPKYIDNLENELDKLILKSNIVLFDIEKGYYGSKRNNIVGFEKNRNKKIKINKIIFKKKFFELKKKLNIKKITRQEFFILFHASYRSCYDKNFIFNKIKYILYHPHNDINEFKELKNDFQRAKVLILIRDPRQDFYSSFKVQKKRQFFKININKFYFYIFFINFLKNFLNTINTIHNEPSSSVKFVLLNDMHIKSNFFLKNLCKFLKIKNEKSLRKTTINNYIWYGNATLPSPISFNKKFKDDWYYGLEKTYAIRIERICEFYFKYFGKKFKNKKFHNFFMTKSNILKDLKLSSYIEFLFYNLGDSFHYMLDRFTPGRAYLFFCELLLFIKKIIFLPLHFVKIKKNVTENILENFKQTKTIKKKDKIRNLINS